MKTSAFYLGCNYGKKQDTMYRNFIESVIYNYTPISCLCNVIAYLTKSPAGLLWLYVL